MTIIMFTYAALRNFPNANFIVILYNHHQNILQIFTPFAFCQYNDHYRHHHYQIRKCKINLITLLSKNLVNHSPKHFSSPLSVFVYRENCRIVSDDD